MRKFILSICIVLLLGLGGCNSQSEFEKAMINLNEVESVQIDLTVSMMGIRVDSEVIVNGDYTKTTIIGETMYNYYSGDSYYDFIEYPAAWVLIESQLDMDDIDFSELSSGAEFQEADFELEDEWYVYQIEDEDFPGLKIKIVDDFVTEMYMALEDEGLDIEMTFEFSNYNNASFNLPENIMSAETYQGYLNQFVEAGMDFDIHPDYITFACPGNTWIDCDPEEDYCVYNENTTSWQFSMNGSNFDYMDEGYTSLDDLYANAELELSQETFELIMEVLDALYV